jgi:hypothetical protein
MSSAMPTSIPSQHQDRQPGLQTLMDPAPISDHRERPGSGKLKDRVVLITGGDSGIGRAIAVTAAKWRDLGCLAFPLPLAHTIIYGPRDHHRRRDRLACSRSRLSRRRPSAMFRISSANLAQSATPRTCPCLAVCRPAAHRSPRIPARSACSPAWRPEAPRPLLSAVPRPRSSTSRSCLA